eukprot:689081-Pelagomonas_calceolata.AAC.1
MEELAAIAPHSHRSQLRKGGQGQGKGLRHKGASCCTKPGAGGAGAGAKSTDEEMEDWERLRASA